VHYVIKFNAQLQRDRKKIRVICTSTDTCDFLQDDKNQIRYVNQSLRNYETRLSITRVPPNASGTYRWMWYKSLAVSICTRPFVVTSRH